MPETTIYLSLIRGEESLTLDGSLHLFNELVTVFTNATKETPSLAPDPPAPVADQATPIKNADQDG